MIRIAILIDGGHVRATAKKAKLSYDVELVADLAMSCAQDGESVFRVLYYDCPPYNGTAKKPVSGLEHVFDGNDDWLRRLAARELFAVRRGVFKFRGWKPKNVPVSPSALTDEDFAPDFEQKGVDMRIGLDIATFSASKAVQRIVLVTGDTDCIPAMKHGRIAGLQMVLAALPKHSPAAELKHHSDYVRQLAWPESARKKKPLQS